VGGYGSYLWRQALTISCTDWRDIVHVECFACRRALPTLIFRDAHERAETGVQLHRHYYKGLCLGNLDMLAGPGMAGTSTVPSFVSA
jgi:hypothetical protein